MLILFMLEGQDQEISIYGKITLKKHQQLYLSRLYMPINSSLTSLLIITNNLTIQIFHSESQLIDVTNSIKNHLRLASLILILTKEALEVAAIILLGKIHARREDQGAIEWPNQVDHLQDSLLQLQYSLKSLQKSNNSTKCKYNQIQVFVQEDQITIFLNQHKDPFIKIPLLRLQS